MSRTPRAPLLAALAAAPLLLAPAGCVGVSRSRYDDARLKAQSLQAENSQLRDVLVSVRTQNRDMNQRAVEDARRVVEEDTGTQLRWCFDIPGEAGVDAADITLDLALRLRPDGLVSYRAEKNVESIDGLPGLTR